MKKTSYSKLVGAVLHKEMSDEYWRAYGEWKRLPRDLGGAIDTSMRLTRGEVHERR
jgi:hypothetical protein